MREVLIDAQQFEGAGLGFQREGDSTAAWFTIPSGIEGVPDRLVGVRASGDKLHFFPERSAGQREVLKLIDAE